jgi:hypothetical protein
VERPPGGPTNERAAAGDGGAALWDVLRSFVDARLTFRRIYRRYERQVLTAARARGVPRAHLVLPPDELERLFDLAALERLRDRDLLPLRDRAEAIFGGSGDEGLLDTYCGHAYHEVSILCAEHRAVGRFTRIHDPERYRELFAEVSGYYPTRLRRIRRFFEQGLKRLEELLPAWARHRVVVRSAYLFGEELAQRAWGEGQAGLYRRMYPGQGGPEQGAARGLLEAAHSFHAAGFDAETREALARARQAAAAGSLAAEVESFARALGAA